jgi:DNA modification methylase
MMNADSPLIDFFQNLDACEEKRGLTHGVHPYPAKFIPHIPREVIRHLSEPGQVVLDPMCGSGTTIVEAIVNGRIGIGSDINPISTLITKAKTQPVELESLTQLRELIKRLSKGVVPKGEVPDFHNRDHWFAQEVSEALAGLLDLISNLPSESARTLAKSALSAIIVGVSRQDSETRWVRTEREIGSVEVVSRFLRRLEEHINRSQELNLMELGVGWAIRADARHLPLADSSVDLVVTSPPYANSHDYYLYNKLRLFWLGFDVHDVQEAEFGSRNKHSDRKMPIDHYLDSMAGVFIETSRVLKHGSHACVVVGDAVIRGDFFDMGEHLPSYAVKAGLKLKEHHRFGQQRYTRAFTRGFGTIAAKSTHVLIFETHAAQL